MSIKHGNVAGIPRSIDGEQFRRAFFPCIPPSTPLNYPLTVSVHEVMASFLLSRIISLPLAPPSSTRLLNKLRTTTLVPTRVCPRAHFFYCRVMND